jgi:hypothetical protein
VCVETIAAKFKKRNISFMETPGGKYDAMSICYGDAKVGRSLKKRAEITVLEVLLNNARFIIPSIFRAMFHLGHYEFWILKSECGRFRESG